MMLLSNAGFRGAGSPQLKICIWVYILPSGSKDLHLGIQLTSYHSVLQYVFHEKNIYVQVDYYSSNLHYSWDNYILLFTGNGQLSARVTLSSCQNIAPSYMCPFNFISTTWITFSFYFIYWFIKSKTQFTILLLRFSLKPHSTECMREENFRINNNLNLSLLIINKQLKLFPGRLFIYKLLY